MSKKTVIDRMRVDGKVAVVTGAGRGLGKGLALALAEAGADVACIARTKANIEDTAGLLEEIVGPCHNRMNFSRNFMQRTGTIALGAAPLGGVDADLAGIAHEGMQGVARAVGRDGTIALADVVDHEGIGSRVDPVHPVL